MSVHDEERNSCYGQEMGPFAPKEYIPEVWTIEKDLVRGLAFSAEAGLEYAQECLIRHDQELGRTTKKNKSWAETIESDIRQMKQTLENLKKYEQQRN